MPSSISSSKPAASRLAQRYLAALALVIACGGGALAVFNFWVDPYDVFAMLRGEQPAIRIGSGTRLSKAYAIREIKPDCLILGTSRAAIGYSSASTAWKCERPYNAGLPKAHLYEVRRYLQHAVAQRGVRQVFLALDFEMFRNTDRTMLDYDDERLAVDAGGHRQFWPLNEVLGLLLSLDVTRTSWQVHTAPTSSPWFAPAGDWNPAALSAGLRIPELGTARVSEGAVHLLADLMGRKGAFTLGADGQLAQFSELIQIIDLCKANDIHLAVAVDPVHASYHELLALIALDARYDQWKAQVGRVLAARLPQQKYWDFDQRNAYAAEAIPPDGDLTSSMSGFWDPSHFRLNVGNAAMALALGNQDRPAMQMLGLPEDARAQPAQSQRDWQQRDAVLSRRVSSWLATARK